MTTDLVPKIAARTVDIDGRPVRILGVCKGSGMIAPRMTLHATMLAYVFTDADVPLDLLRTIWRQSVGVSFNRVTVDRDTSTNDTAAVFANGASGVEVDADDAFGFADAVTEVCTSLARQIAADGEGATKMVTVEVAHAASDDVADRIGRSIADSLLVKTALHGNDPNWGRIIAAAGYSGADFEPEKATLYLAGTKVFEQGTPLPVDFAAVSKQMKTPELTLRLDCGVGSGAATVWTCDLSREYIAINADYTS